MFVLVQWKILSWISLSWFDQEFDLWVCDPFLFSLKGLQWHQKDSIFGHGVLEFLSFLVQREFHLVKVSFFSFWASCNFLFFMINLTLWILPLTKIRRKILILRGNSALLSWIFTTFSQTWSTFLFLVWRFFFALFCILDSNICVQWFYVLALLSSEKIVGSYCSCLPIRFLWFEWNFFEKVDYLLLLFFSFSFLALGVSCLHMLWKGNAVFSLD